MPYTAAMSIFSGRLSRKNFILGYLIGIFPVPVIGLIAAIVLASLGAAREKAREASANEQVQYQQMQQMIDDQSQSPQI
jgi:Mg2+/citrate symporter